MINRKSLAGTWKLTAAGIGPIAAEVPGTAADALLSHGIMPDPYKGLNESFCAEMLDKDFTFTGSFELTEEELARKNIDIVCEGLDTVCDITVNGEKIGSACNMHRTWRYSVKNNLLSGSNTLEIAFMSPAAYLREHPSMTGKPFSVIRKASCMFGWDWGLCLPDSGIWRNIYLESYDSARFGEVIVHQDHSGEIPTLSVNVGLESSGDNCGVKIIVRAPDGNEVYKAVKYGSEGICFSCKITDPQLWWPVGEGASPLYTLELVLFENGAELDRMLKRVGLRKIRLVRREESDIYSANGRGKTFYFEVNGREIFIKGESLVIEDAFLSRSTDEKWSNLIAGAIKSNLNCIRVWGGAYYPPEEFYDLCDEAGILVWQDLMFACTFYMPTEEMTANVMAEVRDNVSRFAHHACLALLCGNNELDVIYTTMTSDEPRTEALRKLFGAKDKFSEETKAFLRSAYSGWFGKLFPSICGTYAPDTPWICGSPDGFEPLSSGSMWDYLSCSDMHYYLQYDGNLPYREIDNLHSRFISEIGFQSYPDMKTLRFFANEDELRPDSPLMYAHQKCANGNEAIELYMSREYGVPARFPDYVFISQLTAAEIMKYTVDRFRRESDYCRGIILWQMNDCWPVVSWSGIDYFGRWKAQQYFTKRFFAPLTASCIFEENTAAVYVSNLSHTARELTIEAYIIDTVSGESRRLAKDISVGGNKAVIGIQANLSEWVASHSSSRTAVYYAISENGERIFAGSDLMLSAKNCELVEAYPDIVINEQENRYVISLAAKSYLKAVRLDINGADALFEDNWFDMRPGERRNIILMKSDTDIFDCKTLQKNISVETLNGVMRRI